MIDNCGNWKPEADYRTYPKEKWCDYDCIANWIINKMHYNPKTSIENLVVMILFYYEESFDGKEYYGVEDKRTGIDRCLVNVEDVECYVSDSGGLEMFDFEV